MTAARKCWDCGAAIPEGATACPECGLPVEEGPAAGAVPEKAPERARDTAPAAPEPVAAREAAAPARPGKAGGAARPAGSGAPAGGTRTLQAGLVGAVIGAALMYGVMFMLKSMQPSENAVAQQTAQDNGRMPPGGSGMPPDAGAGQAPPLPEDANQKIALLRQAVDKQPDNVMHVVGLANMMYDAGKYADAVPYYRKGLRLDPTNLDARVDLATCLYQAGEARAALAELDTVFRSDSHHANALYNRGVIEKALGHPDAARQAWADYVKYHPEAPRAAQLKAELAGGTQGAPGYKP